MSHYNPKDDPSVINGIQEAYGLKVGDLVEFTNPNGISFSPHKVVGFVQEPDPDFLPENTVYIDTDSYWYPVKPSSLKKIGASEKSIASQGSSFKSAKRAHYPKYGSNCEYSEECMWGVDGWCDRPKKSKCELQEMDESRAKDSTEL